MAYEPHEWKPLEIITNEKLNHIEQGIASANSGGSDGSASGGVGQSMAGQTVKPTYDGELVVAGTGAEIFNDYAERIYRESEGHVFYDSGNIACGEYSHSEGGVTTANGDYSHSEGGKTFANGNCSHAEGDGSKSLGYASHAEGSLSEALGDSSHAEGEATTAIGSFSHSEGSGTEAKGTYSHASGASTKAIGMCSYSIGWYTEARGDRSFSSGDYTIASGDNQVVFGEYNLPSDSKTDRFIIGKGAGILEKSNCFRVTDTGVFASGNYNSSGADYAELFEWADGNPDAEDRCGLFVSLDKAKIKIASPNNKNILGIVSGNPSVIGDVYDDQWQGMFELDVFGRPVYEWRDFPAETVENVGPDGKTETVEIIPARKAYVQKLNPNYDHTQKYIPRSERPEWDAVGMVGKLVVIDDGTCEPGGYCTVGYDDGVATASDEETKFYVMERIDNTHIRVIIIPH